MFLKITMIFQYTILIAFLLFLPLFCFIYPLFMFEKNYFKDKKTLLFTLIIIMTLYLYVNYLIITISTFFNPVLFFIPIIIHVGILYYIYKNKINKYWLFLIFPLFFIGITLGYFWKECSWSGLFPDDTVYSCRCYWISFSDGFWWSKCFWIIDK